MSSSSSSFLHFKRENELNAANAELNADSDDDDDDRFQDLALYAASANFCRERMDRMKLHRGTHIDPNKIYCGLLDTHGPDETHGPLSKVCDPPLSECLAKLKETNPGLASLWEKDHKANVFELGCYESSLKDAEAVLATAQKDVKYWLQRKVIIEREISREVAFLRGHAFPYSTLHSFAVNKDSHVESDGEDTQKTAEIVTTPDANGVKQ